mgnify:CR=1 FL=1
MGHILVLWIWIRSIPKFIKLGLCYGTEGVLIFSLTKEKNPLETRDFIEICESEGAEDEDEGHIIN